MSEDKSTIDKLIQLSKIFKKGFTIQISNNDILQYTNKQYKYVVSCETILTISNSHIKYHAIKNLDDKLKYCFIGGWLDKDDNIYYIEFNRIFSSEGYALEIAKKYKQKYIYDLNEGKEIKV